VPNLKEDQHNPKQLPVTNEEKSDSLLVMTGLLDERPSKPRATRRCMVCIRLSISYKASQNLKKVGSFL
jgi:hypothetical protein